MLIFSFFFPFSTCFFDVCSKNKVLSNGERLKVIFEIGKLKKYFTSIIYFILWSSYFILVNLRDKRIDLETDLLLQRCFSSCQNWGKFSLMLSQSNRDLIIICYFIWFILYNYYYIQLTYCLYGIFITKFLVQRCKEGLQGNTRSFSSTKG